MKRWWIVGALAASVLGLVGLLVRRSRAERHSLLDRTEALNRYALAQLQVPAESSQVSVNGVRLHLVTAGPLDGPLVILLHGFPECWYSWRKQIKPLAQAGYRVVVPDQRGYNLSEKPAGVSSYQLASLTADLAALVRALGRQQAFIVGHDWGGVVAWCLAMAYPDIVAKLIVMNAPHPMVYARVLRQQVSQWLKSWYAVFFQTPWLPETLLGAWPLSTARLFFRRTAVRQAAFSNADLEVMAAALAQPGALKGMLSWYRAVLRDGLQRWDRVIRAPTLLLWGENDVALSLALTEGLEDWAPDLTKHTIAHCGHWVQNEAPEEVGALLMAFLQGG